MSALLFNHYKHNPLGDRLRGARLDKGITVKKACADLNIASKYLEAIENNQPKLLPTAEYFDKYLQQYGAYLGLNPNELNTLRERAVVAQVMTGAKSRNIVAVSELLGRIFMVVIIVGMALFLAFKLSQIFQPPLLTILSPEDDSISHQQSLEISGLSVPEAEIVINNKAVFVDSVGKFSTVVDLQKGLNLIKITAKKRYSRSSEAEVRVLYNE